MAAVQNHMPGAIGDFTGDEVLDVLWWGRCLWAVIGLFGTVATRGKAMTSSVYVYQVEARRMGGSEKDEASLRGHLFDLFDLERG